MKATKSEVTYFILSIILIALAGGIYFVFGNTHTSTSSSQPKTSISSSSTIKIGFFCFFGSWGA